MESDILQVRFTEEGKKYIRKFVNISYVIMAFVVLSSLGSIYMDIKFLEKGYALNISNGRTLTFVSMIGSIMSVVSNIFYVRFPYLLLKSLEQNDEIAANKSFNFLFKSGLIFIIWLMLSSAMLAWHLLHPPF